MIAKIKFMSTTRHGTNNFSIALMSNYIIWNCNKNLNLPTQWFLSWKYINYRKWHFCLCCFVVVFSSLRVPLKRVLKRNQVTYINWIFYKIQLSCSENHYVDYFRATLEKTDKEVTQNNYFIKCELTGFNLM